MSSWFQGIKGQVLLRAVVFVIASSGTSQLLESERSYVVEVVNALSENGPEVIEQTQEGA